MLDEENGHLAAKLDAEIWERRKAQAELERMRPVVEAACNSPRHILRLAVDEYRKGGSE